ncbi:MAG: hypothetical protein DM484_08165 [Candidatus Methylumidiphilus alinenensis]|uniref:Uncharacterized protein n=1 Tax=Candidatus Methylumidiphilus alinenensis TaxID=2202197 RepID=A0A2W4RFL5_9GAMM|nr:MAG: hypothetical protein DM484_08165 [Candidatus Methylumidiphilus alinenensis]
MSTPLEILESQLQSAITGGSITLPNSLVTEANLTGFINKVIGNQDLTVTGVSLSGDGALVLNGNINLFSVSLALAWTFNYDSTDGITWTFEASTGQSGVLGNVITHYLSSITGVPSVIPNLTLTNIQLSASLDLHSKNYNLSLTADSDWGDVTLLVDFDNGAWGAALGIALNSSVNLTDIWSGLQPFAVLTFSNSVVVIANFTDPTVQIAGVTGVIKGVMFLSTLTLTETTGSSSVAQIANALAEGLSGTEIDATIDINTAQNDITLTATIPGPFAFPGSTGPKALTFSDVDFTFETNPVSASLAGNLIIPTTIPGNPGVSQITVTGATSFSYNDGTGNIEATLSSTTQIAEPFKITGFTLLDIGFGMDISFGALTGVGLLFAGGFMLGQNTLTEQFALAIDFDDDFPNPSLLYLNSSSLSLQVIFNAVIDPSIHLPRGLSGLLFSPLVLYWCDKSQTVPVGPLSGSACQPGVGFNAGINLWGFDAYAALMINQGSGITGNLDIDPISLWNGNITVTGNGTGGNGVQPGGASFDFDTSSESFTGSLNANILGLTTQNSVAFSSGSLALTMSDNTGFLLESVNVSFSGKDNMSFTSTLNVNLNVSPTITIGNYKLGTIQIKDSLDGSLSVSVNGTSLSAKVNGTFSWNNHGFSVSVDLGGNLNNLKDLPEAIAAAIVKDANTIFGNYFSDVTKYLQALGAGLLSDGDFVLDVLAHAYNEEVDSIISLLAQLQAGVHIDGNPDFHIDVSQCIPAHSFHADLGQIINYHFDHHIFTHEDAHGDVDAGTNFSTPQFTVSLLDINPNQHFDLAMPPQVHADASSPHLDISPHIDIGIAGGSVEVGGNAGVNAKISLSNPSFTAQLSVNEHADAHADVSIRKLHIINKHGDTGQRHQDIPF